MPVVSSSLTQSTPERDGRTWVFESHVDDQGNHYEFNYLADAGLDVNAVMAERALEIDAQLAAGAS